jgi:ribose transport system substrate-binding protein
MNRNLWLAALAFGVSTTVAGAAFGEDIDSQAKANVEKLGATKTAWTGPASAPKIEKGKKIAYLSANEQNDAEREWGMAIVEAGKKAGWTVTVIDGRGSPVSWLAGMNQAISLQVDGIITSADARSLAMAIKQAGSLGIPIVGIHAAGTPGPQTDLGLFTNIQEDPKAIGEAQADWIIANSDGKANVVITTSGEYAIAMVKANAVKDRLAKCSGCKVVEFSNTPLAEAAQRQPQLVTSWVQRYGMPLYITAIADYTLDFQVPALKAGGADPSKITLIGSDGTKSAYGRIRGGNQFQKVTVAEPNAYLGYQAVDEMNRALNKEQPSGTVPLPYLVTSKNIDVQGGKDNTYVPDNDFAKRYLKLWGVE